MDSQDTANRLLYPSFDVVSEIARAVAHFHNGYLAPFAAEVEAAYAGELSLHPPLFNRCVWGAFNEEAVHPLLCQSHYLFSNMREYLDPEQEALIRDLLQNMQENQPDWAKYIENLGRIYPGWRVEGMLARILSVLEDDSNRPQAMQELGRLLMWPITGGLTDMADHWLASVSTECRTPALLLHFEAEGIRGKGVQPDLHGYRLGAHDDLAYCTDEGVMQQQLPSVAWTDEPGVLTGDRETTENIVNRLSIALGIPEAAPGNLERLALLMMPVYEWHQPGLQSAVAGHCLGWITFPILAGRDLNALIAAIRKNPDPLVHFMRQCYGYGNALSTELMGATARECVRNSTTNEKPEQQMRTLLHRWAGWDIEVIGNNTAELPVEDGFYDDEEKCVLARLGQDTGNNYSVASSSEVLKLTVMSESYPAKGATYHRFMPPTNHLGQGYAQGVAHRLRTIHSLVINKIKTARQVQEEWQLDVHCAYVLSRFASDCYLALIGERQSEAFARDRHQVIREALVAINQICEEAAEEAELPRVVFTLAGGGIDSLWDCYVKVTDELPNHDSAHKWLETEAHNYLLTEIGFYVEPGQVHGDTLIKAHRLKQVLTKVLGIYILQDLWSQVQAIEQSLHIGRMSERHTVHHEVGRLLNVLSIHLKKGIHSDADSDLASWAISILRARILAIGDHGESGIQARETDRCDLQTFMAHVQGLERPQSVDFNGWPSQVKVLFGPSPEDWRARISDANFYAIWNNLWRNAHDALTIYSWAGGNPGPKLGPRVAQIEREYGAFVDRFEDELPQPRMLVLIRQLEGENAIAFEVLDNAPELLGRPVTYVTRRTEDGHMGNHILRDVEQAMCQAGVKARYEPASALRPEQCQAISDLVDKMGVDGLNGLEAAQWTRAAFIIERLM